MKKCIALLTAALLLNAVVSRAEGNNMFYTARTDRYYHADADCDRPKTQNWWNDETRDFYEREIYQKYEITETAAVAFDKAACPICVKKICPVYLGDFMPEWNFEVEPWEINGLTEAEEKEFREARPAEFQKEIAATAEAFSAYYAESYNDETNTIERAHEYPPFFAGKYAGNAGSTVYQLVDFDEEMLAAFKAEFGGGAWIVPAKYGYDEIYAAREEVFSQLMAWCAAHTEVDAQVVSAGGPDYENYAVIGIDGADWEKAAAAVEDIAPVYVHFCHEKAQYSACEF